MSLRVCRVKVLGRGTQICSNLLSKRPFICIKYNLAFYYDFLSKEVSASREINPFTVLITQLV